MSFLKNKCGIGVRLAVLMVVLVQMAVMVVHIISDLKVKNEYLYLDQKTILADGSVVSNDEFETKNLVINEVKPNFEGTSSSLSVYNNSNWDINRIPKFQYFAQKNYGNISKSENKYNYLTRDLSRLFVFEPYRQAAVTYFHTPLFEYYNRTCLNIEAIRVARDRYLLGHRPQDGNSALSQDFESCQGERSQAYFPLLQADDDAALQIKLDFVAKNLDEKYLQAFDRYYFHEVPFVLAPINEIHLGKPLKQVFSQYGYLSILAVSAAMDTLGGLSFPNYEKAIKFSYLLYYLIYLVVVLTVFKQPATRAAAVLIFSLGFFANSYYFYQYPPGHAPLRHFFDLFIFLCAWRFDQGRRIGFFLLGGALVVLSIFTDKDYGLLMTAAFFAASVYYGVYRWAEGGAERIRLLLAVLLVMAASVIALNLYPLAANPSSAYFLDGFYSFYVPWAAFAMVLLSILLQALVALVFGRRLFQQGRFFVFLFAAFYSQLLYFYFVWGGGHAHFFTLISLYMLPYLLLLDLVDWRASVWQRGVAGFGFAVILLATIGNAVVFLQDYRRAVLAFEDHVTYRWDLPRARGMITKIDPDLFADGVEKIQHHATGNQIAMLSKYDSMLSILASKYTSLPFFELRSMITTEEEYRRVKERLASSALLFVDNDIDRDFDAEMNRMTVWNIEPKLFVEHSEQRIPKLKVLRQLYRDVVKDNYELIDQGRLISVYRRKSPA
jgi:hypothetical protein